MAVVNLIQGERETVKSSEKFKTYLKESIMSPEAGGVSYLLGLSNFASPALAKAYVVSIMIQSNPNMVYQDSNIAEYMMLRMLARDTDKKDDAAEGDVVDQVIAYLDAADQFRINSLVTDYFAEKSKSW